MAKVTGIVPTDQENHTVDSVYIPGTGVAAVEGGPVNTDPATGFSSAPIADATVDPLTGTPIRIANKLLPIAAVAITAGTPVTVWTPAAGRRFRVIGWSLSLSVAGSILFKDEAAEAFRTPLLTAASPYDSPPMFGQGYLSATPNNHLKLDATASGSVSGFVFGVEE